MIVFSDEVKKYNVSVRTLLKYIRKKKLALNDLAGLWDIPPGLSRITKTITQKPEGNYCRQVCLQSTIVT